MKKNLNTKKTALNAAEKVIRGEPLTLDEFESLEIIKEGDTSLIKSMVDEETMTRLTKLRCWARGKNPCQKALRILATISKKFQEAEFKKEKK